MQRVRSTKQRLVYQTHHTLEGFFIIKNGKIIKILISGKTLNHCPGKVVVQKSFIELPSITVGLLYPIEIPVSLSNIGEMPLKYEINLALFDQQNPGLVESKVIGFGNPRGQLNALKESSLFIYYRPSELRLYSFNVELIIFDYFKEIQRILISFKGMPLSSLNQNAINNFFKNDDIFLKERIQVEVEPDSVYISEDLINFKNSRLGFTETRIIFLMNTSQTKTYAFNFLLFQMSRFSHQCM